MGEPFDTKVQSAKDWRTSTWDAKHFSRLLWKLFPRPKQVLLLEASVFSIFSAYIQYSLYVAIDLGDHECLSGIAHDARYLDLAGTSLVSRVCAGDGSLILSTVQATLIEHINDFLGLQPEEFAMNVWQPGTLLCMLCILLWSLCVYKDPHMQRRWSQHP